MNEAPRFTAPITKYRHLRLLDRSTPILDIGSGYGRALDFFHSLGFSSLFGLEPDPRFFVEGRSYPVVAARGETAPFRSRSFGAVVMVGVLSYILEDKRREALFKELERILLPDGLLCGSCFLLSPDPYHQRKYRQGRTRFGVDGAFESDSGGIYRHSRAADLQRLLDHFDILHWKRETFTTQNQRQAQGLVFEAMKKE